MERKSPYYILNGKEAVGCPDITTWARWLGEYHTHVALDYVRDITGRKVRVSTVFLGLNHNYGEGTPLLFETMVFGGILDQEQWRCSTWEQAEKIHATALRAVALTCRWDVRIALWLKAAGYSALRTLEIALDGAYRALEFLFRGNKGQ